MTRRHVRPGKPSASAADNAVVASTRGLPGPKTERAKPREWIGLAVLTLPVLLVSMDMTVLHLAIPQITRDLEPSGTEILWIVDIYAFMVAGLLITMGAVGDRIGRRRLLLIGATAFAVASLAAAFATGPGMLIAARAALGIAGATLAPSTLALIRTMFVDPEQRSTATSIWVLAFLTGAAVGPIVGGLLLQTFWWGSVFLLGVPIMVVLLGVAPFVLPEFRDTAAARVDLLSAATSLAAVLTVVYGLKEAAAGKDLLLPAVAVGVGGLLSVVFVRRQQHLPRPLIDLALFRQRSFAVAIGVLTLGSMVLAGVGFLTAQYLQLVLGLNPLTAGLWTLPPLGAGIAAVVLTQALGDRITAARGTVVGMLVTVVGLLVLTQVPTSGETPVVVGLALVFAGLMPVLARGVDIVTGAATPERAGAASALSETTQELGGALGIAVLGSIATAIYQTKFGPVLDGLSTTGAGGASDTLAGAVGAADPLPAAVLAQAIAAFNDGLHAAAAVGAAVVFLAAGVAAVAFRPARPARPPED